MTDPGPCQRPASADSLGYWDGEPWTEGESDTARGHNVSLATQEAPRAQPEEYDDVFLEDTLQETLQLSTFRENADASTMEPMGAESEPSPKGESDRTQAHKGHEGSLTVVGDICPPTPPAVDASPSGGGAETEGYSGLEVEDGECVSELDIPSDSVEEDIMCFDTQISREWPWSPHLSDLNGRALKSTDGTTDDPERTDGKTTQEAQRASLPYSLNSSECGNNSSGDAAETNPSALYPSSGKVNLDDTFSLRSPPFADEYEEVKEEVNANFKHRDIFSICRDAGKLDRSCLDGTAQWPPQPSASGDSSEGDTESAQPAVTSCQQQEVQQLRGQSGHTLKGENQEEAQQVLSQVPPPLSAISMETANQSAAGPRGSGCAGLVRERSSGAGGKGEGESRRTEEERGHRERGLGTGKAVIEKHTEGVIEYFKRQLRKTEKSSPVSSPGHSRFSRMESDSFDDSQSDSGMSADFSPCSTLEGNADTDTPPARETPIEREIRRAVEREYSLRRSRGLQTPPTAPEYIQISLRKSILSQGLSERSQGKDRQFAGKKMQWEIDAEAQREQALVKLGTVPGCYDKGTVRELKERKQLFEAFQEPRSESSALSNGSKFSPWASANDLPTLEKQQDVSSMPSSMEGSLVGSRRSTDLQRQTQSPLCEPDRDVGHRGPSLSEGTGCQMIIIEDHLGHPAQTLDHSRHQEPLHDRPSLKEMEPLTVVDAGNVPTSPASGGDHHGSVRKVEGVMVMVRVEEEKEEEEEEEEGLHKENPFFKLRSSTAVVRVEQDIREARERERELRKQRSSLYGAKVVVGEGSGEAGRGGGGEDGTRVSTETHSSLMSSPLNTLKTPDLSTSLSMEGAGHHGAPQSLGKLGCWPPAQAEEEQVNQTEAVSTPRTPRRRTPLLERWESGLVNGNGEED